MSRPLTVVLDCVRPKRCGSRRPRRTAKLEAEPARTPQAPAHEPRRPPQTANDAPGVSAASARKRNCSSTGRPPSATWRAAVAASAEDLAPQVRGDIARADPGRRCRPRVLAPAQRRRPRLFPPRVGRCSGRSGPAGDVDPRKTPGVARAGRRGSPARGGAKPHRGCGRSVARRKKRSSRTPRAATAPTGGPTLRAARPAGGPVRDQVRKEVETGRGQRSPLGDPALRAGLKKIAGDVRRSSKSTRGCSRRRTRWAIQGVPEGDRPGNLAGRRQPPENGQRAEHRGNWPRPGAQGRRDAQDGGGA